MARKEGAVHPAVAAFVIALFIFWLVTWVYALDRRHSVPMPTQMAPLPDGGVLVRFGDRLFPVNAEGATGAPFVIPGLSEYSGLAVTGADSVIVYLGGERPSFSRNLLRFLRLAPPASPPAEGEGLYRCRRAGDCRFLAHAPGLAGVARLYWRPDRERLWVVDSGHHEIRRLENGAEPAPRLGDFRFPNGLLAEPERMLVADTNHHRIAAVNLADDGVRTVARIQPTLLYRWPTDLIRVGDQYWLLVGRDNLEESRLYRYDGDWNLLGRGAADLIDLLSLAPLGKGALVADRGERRLWRLDAEGDPLEEVALPGLAGARERFQYWRRWSDMLLYGGLALVLAGLAFAFWHDRHRLPESFRGDDLHDWRHEKPARGEHWLAPVGLVRLRWLYLVLPVLALWSMGVLAAGVEDPKPLVGMLPLGLVMVPVGLSAFLMFRYVAGCAVGVHGDMLLLQDARGRRVAGHRAEIAYHPTMLVIGEVIVPVGTRAMPLFPRWRMRRLVAPALRGARKLSTRECLRLVWRRRFWPLLAMYLSFVLLFAACTASLLIMG